MPGVFRTLHDLDVMEGERPPAKPSGRVPAMKVKHISSLPDADAALRLLNRIHREFYPIVERRGYHVLSLSEMCCCGDGLDESKTRKRKLRKMGLNVLGYNRGCSNGTCTIHLRLRDARDHNRLLPYEDVAGTMAHELAHCVHGPHNAKFYKLMDEIQEQHAVFLVRGIVADKEGFPADSREAYTLGGGTKRGGRTAAAEAAQTRRERAKWMPQGPQKLGGDAGFRKWLAPGQAAGMAAEARRLRDEMWCQPCQQSDEIIELSDSDEEGEGRSTVVQDGTDDRKPEAVVPQTETESDTNGVMDDRKPAAVTGSPKQGKSKDCAPKRPASVVTIDLTTSDDEDDSPNANAVEGVAAISAGGRERPKQRRRHLDQPGRGTVPRVYGEDTWACSKCTYINPPLALACGMCGTESQPLDSTMKVAAEIRRNDEIEHVKEAEVKRSEEQFGFNIYGKASQATAKLKHIT